MGFLLKKRAPKNVGFIMSKPASIEPPLFFKKMGYPLGGGVPLSRYKSAKKNNFYGLPASKYTILEKKIGAISAFSRVTQIRGHLQNTIIDNQSIYLL